MMQQFELSVREAAEGDAPILVSLIHAAFAEYAGVLDPPSGAHHETMEQIQQALASGHALIAYANARPVACILYQARSDHMYFGRLSVLPDYRRHGIAGQLIDAVEARAAALGLPRVQLGVRVVLSQVRAGYERRGYHVIAERSHAGYTKPTYLIMEKVLHKTRRPVDTEIE